MSVDKPPAGEKGHDMKTRKEIGDEYGARSLYVVEVFICGSVNKWYLYGPEFVSRSRKEAVAEKEQIYQLNKHIKIKGRALFSRKNLRVALYVRAE